MPAHHQHFFVILWSRETGVRHLGMVRARKSPTALRLNARIEFVEVKSEDASEIQHLKIADAHEPDSILETWLRRSHFQKMFAVVLQFLDRLVDVRERLVPLMFFE